MSKLTKSFKGQISRETEKALEITVIKGDELFSTWLPKSALNMKEMPVDCLSKEGVQIFHIHQWFVDLKKDEAKDKAKKESDKTKAGYLEHVDTISTEPIKPKSFEEVKTETVDMPFNPEAVTKSQGDFKTLLLEQILTATLRVGDLLEAMMKK